MALQPLFQEFLHELQNVTMFNYFVISFIFLASVLFLFMYNRMSTTDTDCVFNLPPSPPKLPIIGNLHQLGMLPHRSFKALSERYGPVMFFHVGHAPAVVISSAELAREMIKSHDIIFSNRPQTTAAKILLYGFKDIVFSNYDENWRQARKICVLHLLSAQRVQSFQFVRDEEIASMIGKISSCAKEGNSINLTETIISVINSIVSKCVLGKKSGLDGDRRFSELAMMILKLVGTFCFGDFVPWLGWLDVLTGLIPRMKRTFQEWDSYMDQVIEEHKKVTDKDHQTLVDILLQLQSEDLGDFVLSQHRLKALLLDMIVGGSSTSSSMIEWIMAELIKNPTTMTIAQEEVRRVVDKKTKIEKCDIDQMGYLKCVIKETLRLNCPLPLLVPRVTAANVQLGGYDIPANTQVFINAWAIQRDPQIWGDKAEEFIPDRFENNPIDFKGKDFKYFPFGLGRRGCPGMLFGLALVEHSVANLLYWFNWALPEGLSIEKLDMNEVYEISASKKVSLRVVPSLYSH